MNALLNTAGKDISRCSCCQCEDQVKKARKHLRWLLTKRTCLERGIRAIISIRKQFLSSLRPMEKCAKCDGQMTAFPLQLEEKVSTDPEGHKHCAVLHQHKNTRYKMYNDRATQHSSIITSWREEGRPGKLGKSEKKGVCLCGTNDCLQHV